MQSMKLQFFKPIRPGLLVGIWSTFIKQVFKSFSVCLNRVNPFLPHCIWLCWSTYQSILTLYGGGYSFCLVAFGALVLFKNFKQLVLFTTPTRVHRINLISDWNDGQWEKVVVVSHLPLVGALHRTFRCSLVRLEWESSRLTFKWDKRYFGHPLEGRTLVHYDAF